jgi:glutaredoxin-related protein
MSLILFYSNYCSHSKKLISILAKSNIKYKFKYVCIDDRFKDDKGTTFIRLQSGKSMALPPNITKVPSLLMLNKAGQVLEGDDIYNYIDTLQRKSQGGQGIKGGNSMDNLDCYEMNDFGCVVSDTYSFLDQNSDELSAKGNGGTRQMHNYASIDFVSDIDTPVDDYTPDKVRPNSLDELQMERAKDVKR